ncbi:RNA-binding S4 domain-containing protein [Staphylococcus chromogenes]|nr:RNA-binding S4 domain-containing protein [Staphylococcus chromogenes]
MESFTEPVRIDAWVWAIRLVKTRSAAGEACKAGHVKLNGVAVKPSQQVVPGDRVRVWVDHRQHEVEVVRTIRKRVGAAIARTCYVDHSPPPPPKEIIASIPRRDRGAGRPTKRERREIDRLMGRA